MGFGWGTLSDRMPSIPKEPEDRRSEPRHVLFSKEAEDGPTVLELGSISEDTKIPKITAWATKTGGGEEAAKEMPSGDDVGALEFDGADGGLDRLVMIPDEEHSAHSADAEQKSEGLDMTASAGAHHEDTI